MKFLDLTLFLGTASLAVAGVAQSHSPLEARSGECPGWAYPTQMLTAHNHHRANHSVSALTWNNTLATAAASTAANGALGTHDNNGKGWGQNLYYWESSNANDLNLQGTAAVSWFYNSEFSNYGIYGSASVLTGSNWEPKPEPPYYTHFTQVIWKATQSVGCATATRKTGATTLKYTVCNYYPPGNWVTNNNAWKDNVLPPLGKPVERILCPNGAN